MSYFAGVREAGTGWGAGGIYEQPAVSEHAAFMDALADEGFVLFGGPLAGTEEGRVRVLLMRVEPWKLLVGADRLAVRQ